MTECRYIVGDVFDVLADIESESVDCVITSPPYHLQRRYVPDPENPIYKLEIGQEANPAMFIETAMTYIDELHRVLKPEGTMFLNYGDKSSGSGGAGGDYADGGNREGQGKFGATRGKGWPLAKSVCWEPELIGASMAYGRNLLTGDAHKQWVTRPSVTWCKTSVTPGAIIDKWVPATELVIFATKQGQYFFDIDAARKVDHEAEELGAVEFNWWPIAPSGYKGAHFATFPPALISPLVKAGCPMGGVVLDPFAGSGTTGAVATGHGRGCIMIDFDEENAELARERVGMFLEIERHGDET